MDIAQDVSGGLTKDGGIMSGGVACPYCNELQDVEAIDVIMSTAKSSNHRFICIHCQLTYVVIKEIDGTFTSMEDADAGPVDSTL